MSAEGVVLPKNRRTPWIVGGLCLLGLFPLYLVVHTMVTTEKFSQMFLSILVTAVLVLLFVVAPLGYLWYARTFGVTVGPTDVLWTKNGAPERRLRYADLTEVWVNTGSRGPLGVGGRSVTLNGTDRGADVQIHVGRHLVATLAPLLEPVAAQVARRPKLVEVDPEGFAELVRLEG